MVSTVGLRMRISIKRYTYEYVGSMYDFEFETIRPGGVQRIT